MPTAIAPLVTTTTSTPARRSAATCSQTRSSTSSRGAPESSATIEEPSLMTTRRKTARSLRTRMELEHDAADLHVVARLEPGLLERADHPDALERPLHVRERLVVLQVVARDQPVDAAPHDPEGPVV